MGGRYHVRKDGARAFGRAAALHTSGPNSRKFAGDFAVWKRSRPKIPADGPLRGQAPAGCRPARWAQRAARWGWAPPTNETARATLETPSLFTEAALTQACEVEEFCTKIAIRSLTRKPRV